MTALTMDLPAIRGELRDWRQRAARAADTATPEVRVLLEDRALIMDGLIGDIERLLTAMAPLRADAERLNALQQFAIDNCGVSDHCDLGEIESSCGHEDCDGACDGGADDLLFRVVGPRTRWGRFGGEGPSLRKAIDDAMAKGTDPQCLPPTKILVDLDAPERAA